MNIKGAQYTMVEISPQEFSERYAGDRTKGIPRVFCVSDGRIIDVHPAPEKGIKFMITVLVQ